MLAPMVQRCQIVSLKSSLKVRPIGREHRICLTTRSRIFSVMLQSTALLISAYTAKVCLLMQIIKGMFICHYRNGKSYLQLVARVIQCWLYDDVVNYEFNPNLFDGVSLTLLRSELLGAASNNDKKKEYPKLCTYIDVLKRLADQLEWLPFDESYVYLSGTQTEKTRLLSFSKLFEFHAIGCRLERLTLLSISAKKQNRLQNIVEGRRRKRRL